jgi:NADH-quinone oxidoreductase subunit H
MGFALFFLGESANILFMCAFTSVLFLGGWLPILDIFLLNWIPGVFWFSLKIVFILFLFIWARVAFPRYRYDQLMRLGWKIFLPLSLGLLLLIASLLIFFNMLPF